MDIKSKGTNKKFSSLAKLLHWGFVFIFIYALIKQIDNLNQLEDVNLLRFEVMFALTFLSLLAIRFFYMRKTQQSLLPEQTPKSQKISSQNCSLWNVYMPCSYSLFRINNRLAILVGLKGWVIN